MGLLKLVYSEQRLKYKLHTPKNSISRLVNKIYFLKKK